MAKQKHRTDSFEDVAREHGADETGESFERAFGKIAPPKREGDKSPAKKPKRKSKKKKPGR